MTVLASVLGADSARIAKLRVRSDRPLPHAPTVGPAVQNAWDNRPSWDNWQKR